DLIILNTRGRTGFKKLLMGSVASGVVTYAHCPVMIIR
ncbi:MAG: universal stress protein, partial [Nitrososphaeraceae archaeon]|nr:universal stress protein [Nitrososphaeraceae archaeon]